MVKSLLISVRPEVFSADLKEEKKDPKIGKGNKPTMVSYKPKNESLRKTITTILNEYKNSI